MRTRSSSNFPVESPPNPSTFNPKHRNRRRSKQPFILEESLVDTMADQRTMAELLRAPTEGYAEAIVVPLILAEQFELKHSLINMMTSEQFFRLKKENPHDHIRCAVTTTMTAILKQFQATPPPASVKAVEEICVTCGGAHPYYQCLAAGGNTFPKVRDNIQGYVAAAAINYNQGNFIYRPLGMANQIRPSSFAQPNVQNNQNQFGQPQGYTRGNNFNQDQPYQASTQQNQVVPLSELEKIKRVNEANMKAMQTQIDNVKNELRNEMKNLIQASMSNQTNELKNMMGELKAITTRSGIVLDGPFVPIPPPFINPKEDEPVILKKLPEKLRDPRKFLIPCGFNELKCKAIANLADFVIIDYESNPRVPLILGRPFLRIARALIGVHGEEMILRDGDGRLTLNIRHDTSSYSNQPQKESINLINVFNDSKGGDVLIKKLLDLDSTEDLHPPHHVSTTTSSSLNQLLEEFADELAFITFPPGNDDLPFDIESNLKEIEYMLYRDPIKDMDFIIKDSIDQSKLDDLNDNLIDTMPETFTDKHALDYSSHPLYDEYDDDLFEVESDTEYVYNDPFDSKGKKIKKSKLLIDELDLPNDFLPPSEYDSFLSEDFSKVDALPSTNNEEKVFKLGILIQENLFEVITRVALENKLAISHASLILEDFDPPLYELSVFKEVPRSKTLLLFSF
nr:reverse transcriptase domain-containing protein, chloroplastic [Tanacetum cinerariifolium]